MLYFGIVGYLTLRKGNGGVVKMILWSHAKIIIIHEFLKTFVEKEREYSAEQHLDQMNIYVFVKQKKMSLLKTVGTVALL